MSAATSRQNSLYVSDRPEDEQAAQRVGVPFQWAWDWLEQHQEAKVRWAILDSNQ